MVANSTLYFDLGSPYAYLAVERAGRVLGAEPRLQPILLGAIFKQRGSGSWAHTPEREPGMREVERRARGYGLPPMAWPPDWPSNTLQAMRAAVWAGELGEARSFALAAFRVAFVEGRDLGELSVLLDAVDAAGLPRDEAERAIADQSIKDRLRAVTAAAWDAGVRGVPTLQVDGRLFYGDDQLESAAQAQAQAQGPRTKDEGPTTTAR